MKIDNFNKLETKDLVNKKKIALLYTGILTGIVFIVLIIGTWITVTDVYTPILIIPFAVSPFILMSFLRISEMNKELNKRKKNL